MNRPKYKELYFREKNLNKQVKSDLEDLSSMYFFIRCPLCTHLVHYQNICSVCGCDDSVYKDGEYSKEEIKEMKSRK